MADMLTVLATILFALSLVLALVAVILIDDTSKSVKLAIIAMVSAIMSALSLSTALIFFT